MAYQEDILFDIDTDYLKDMNAISSNQSKLSDIHNKIDAKQKEQNKVEENYKKYKKVNEKLDSDMKNLKNREKDISNQTKTLTAEKNKLEREALELENFIADLINSQSGDGSTQVNNILIERPCQGPIVKQFGEKLNALSNVHYKGLNINVPPGNDVHAVYSGKIIYNGYVKSKGQVVIVDHKNGFVSVYAYNSSVKVNKDDEVKQGDVIGVSGTNSSGVPMVYFELRKNNIPVNPEVYFK
ncbi:MAG: hypothetical protein B6226_03375 [Candidatus Cloacimonetes bacterium 4572_65]|nr:MAG: hypothetical protein B6226_03375 [Candidatus Cloacimonetes bacterium 4572_65]